MTGEIVLPHSIAGRIGNNRYAFSLSVIHTPCDLTPDRTGVCRDYKSHHTPPMKKAEHPGAKLFGSEKTIIYCPHPPNLILDRVRQTLEGRYAASRTISEPYV